VRFTLSVAKGCRLSLLRIKPRGKKPRDKEELSVPRHSPDKLIGLLFGGVVVIVMLFMMFVILGNLILREQ
jgi:hypothetical protein